MPLRVVVVFPGFIFDFASLPFLFQDLPPCVPDPDALVDCLLKDVGVLPCSGSKKRSGEDGLDCRTAKKSIIDTEEV